MMWFLPDYTIVGNTAGPSVLAQFHVSLLRLVPALESLLVNLVVTLRPLGGTTEHEHSQFQDTVLVGARDVAVSIGIDVAPCRTKWVFSEVHVMLVTPQDIPLVAVLWEFDDEVLFL